MTANSDPFIARRSTELAAHTNIDVHLLKHLHTSWRALIDHRALICIRASEAIGRSHFHSQFHLDLQPLALSPSLASCPPFFLSVSASIL